jgi:hypothetical protein
MSTEETWGADTVAIQPELVSHSPSLPSRNAIESRPPRRPRLLAVFPLLALLIVGVAMLRHSDPSVRAPHNPATMTRSDRGTAAEPHHIPNRIRRRSNSRQHRFSIPHAAKRGARADTEDPNPTQVEYPAASPPVSARPLPEPRHAPTPQPTPPGVEFGM